MEPDMRRAPPPGKGGPRPAAVCNAATRLQILRGIGASRRRLHQQGKLALTKLAGSDRDRGVVAKICPKRLCAILSASHLAPTQRHEFGILGA